MKRTKLLSILALLLIVVLISLSFIKLPISTLTNERIQSETQGYVSFHGAEAQSLLLLPTPKIELLDSFFSITHPSIKLDIFSSNTELSKSLFNDENIHITSSKTTLENIETDLFNNSVLLEDVIENLKIEILSEKEFTEIKSNNFIYKGAEFQFSFQLQNEKLKKLSFSIDGLDVNELILLLDKKYQKFFKQISFATLNIKGEYSYDNLVFEKFDLITEDDAKLSILGSIDIKNIFNSDLNIIADNLSSKTVLQIVKNFDLIDIFPELPEGTINKFDISLQGNKIEINNIEYLSKLLTKINLIGDISNLDIYNSVFKIQVSSPSSKEIMNFTQTLLPNINIPNFKFDQFDLDGTIENNNFVINSLTLNDKETVLETSGSVNLSNNYEQNFDLKLFNLKKSKLLQFFPQLSDTINLIPGKIINFDGFISGSYIEISNLEILKEDEPSIVIAGDLNLQNLNETFLNVKIEKITSSDLEIILNDLDQQSLRKYLDTYSYDKLSGNLFFDFKDKSILVDKIIIHQEDKEVGNIVGRISDYKFTGDIILENINLSSIDQNFLKTERLNGFLNLIIKSPSYVSDKSFTDLEGSINGEIKINISEDELALVLFMQLLSQDIEDLEQINQLLSTLSNSFINKKIIINSNIENPSKNKIVLNDLSFKSTDGKVLFGKIEYMESNFKITLFDIIDEDDFIIKYENGSYSYERVIPDGTVRKPLEELIQKNINKLFENLLQ